MKGNPDFSTSAYRAALHTLTDGAGLWVQVIRDVLAGDFGLTEAELDQRLPSGPTNRVASALSHLKDAGLSSRHGAASTGAPIVAARRSPRPTPAAASITAS